VAAIIHVSLTRDGLRETLCNTPDKLQGWLPRDIAMRHDNQRFLDLLDLSPRSNGDDHPPILHEVPIEIWERTTASCDSCFAVGYFVHSFTSLPVFTPSST
jgi:hypothetical protein